MDKKRPEFEEIGHSGGKVTVTVGRTEHGLAYSIGFSNSNPVPLKIVSLYALPQGIPVERITTAGMGVPFPPPKVPGSYVVMLASDREGWFGRTCAFCKGYWRSGDAAQTESGFCVYCGKTPMGTLALTSRQRMYVQAVCGLITDAVQEGPGVYEWDLDELSRDTKADPASTFYLSDERQQTRSVCLACGTGQDVLGKASYCCACGTRNDRELAQREFEAARARAKAGALEGALRDSVSALDGVIGAIVAIFVERVPMTSSRRSYWSGNRPRHNLREVLRRLDDDFGLKIMSSLKTGELDHAHKMVARRHLHEHRGGVVDQRYLDETGERLRLGQALSETQEEVFAFIGTASRMVSALMDGFHEMFPPCQKAIALGEKYRRVPRAKAQGETLEQ